MILTIFPPGKIGVRFPTPVFLLKMHMTEIEIKRYLMLCVPIIIKLIQVPRSKHREIGTNYSTALHFLINIIGVLTKTSHVKGEKKIQGRRKKKIDYLKGLTKRITRKTIPSSSSVNMYLGYKNQPSIFLVRLSQGGSQETHVKET